MLPERHPQAFLNFRYTERLLKFLLWSRGGTRVYFDGPVGAWGSFEEAFFIHAQPANFDADFMSRVYETPFEVILTPDLPSEQSSAQKLGRNLRWLPNWF